MDGLHSYTSSSTQPIHHARWLSHITIVANSIPRKPIRLSGSADPNVASATASGFGCSFKTSQLSTSMYVRVDVEVTEVCQHVDDGDKVVVERPNRQQLRSDQRAESAELLTSTQQSETEVHYRRLGEMSEAECIAGNTTTCQTPAVLRQAAYEHRRCKYLYEHVQMELDIAWECWEASTPGVHITGYIQQLGIFPFNVLFYTERQVTAYVAQCKSASGATVHIDATGTIVRRIPGQKAMLYYCMWFADGNLLVLDFITSWHEVAWTQGLFESFNSSVRRAEVDRHRLLIRTDARLYPDLQWRNAAQCVSAANVQGTVSQLQVGTDEECDIPLSLCLTHAEGVVDVTVQSCSGPRLQSTGGDILCCSTTHHWLGNSRMDLQTHCDSALQQKRDNDSRQISPSAGSASGAEVTVDDAELPEPPLNEDDETAPMDFGTLKCHSPFTEYFNGVVNDVTSATSPHKMCECKESKEVVQANPPELLLGDILYTPPTTKCVMFA